jgi:uncharacterized protein
VPPLVALSATTRPAILRAMNDAIGTHPFADLPPGTRVTIRALKYDGREYRRWHVEYVGPVVGGVERGAVFSPVVEGRTPFFGGDRAAEFFYADRGYNVIAGYAPDGALRACYCNICAPARFAGDPDGPEISFVDLDLDVLVWPDGRCVVTDEDDFARNTVAYGYPPALQAAARDAVSALLRAVKEREAPFDRIGLLAPAEGV